MRLPPTLMLLSFFQLQISSTLSPYFFLHPLYQYISFYFSLPSSSLSVCSLSLHLPPSPPLSFQHFYLPCLSLSSLFIKGNTKFWYGVMNLVQMNILEAYTILQYSVIVFAVEIESKVMKL